MSDRPSRIFVSHLSNVAVFDPNGDQVGRIRDLVVTLPAVNATAAGQGAGRPPRVLGFAVEVVGKRRVFLPTNRVTSVESGQVITTGVINMRRFQQRPSETLVLAELLDRRVALREDTSFGAAGDLVTVLDVGMVRPRRDWEIDKVFVQEGRPGRLRRSRGGTHLVDWSAVTGFALPEEDQGAANLLATFEQLRPADLANMLHHLSEKRRTEVAAALDDERLADVMEELPEDDQVGIIGALHQERAADVLEAMDPDDAADLLSELPGQQAEHLLQLMEPDEAAPLRRLLTYADDTAGGLMTTEPIVLPPSATVAEALALIRNPDLKAAEASMVFVCRPPTETPTGRYLGLVHFQRLLREPPYTQLGGIVDRDLDPLTTAADLRAVSSHLATYNLVSAPVVDDEGHLVGSVTVDDVLDHLLPEDWRDAVTADAADAAGAADTADTASEAGTTEKSGEGATDGR